MDEEDSWWPEAEGVTLIDEEAEEEEPREAEDESVKESYVCSSYGEKFRLNSRGCDKITITIAGKR